MKSILSSPILYLILLVNILQILEAQETCEVPSTAEGMLEKVKSIKNEIDELVKLANTIASSPPADFLAFSFLVENDKKVIEIKVFENFYKFNFYHINFLKNKIFHVNN